MCSKALKGRLYVQDTIKLALPHVRESQAFSEVLPRGMHSTAAKLVRRHSEGIRQQMYRLIRAQFRGFPSRSVVTMF